MTTAKALCCCCCCLVLITSAVYAVMSSETAQDVYDSTYFASDQQRVDSVQQCVLLLQQPFTEYDGNMAPFL
eukprot:4517-Heterococcus_DN1.PRE.2